MSQCPVTSCGVTIPSDRLMCRSHWYSVPRELRDDLWRAIRRHGWFSDEAEEARAECIRAADQRESAGSMQPQLPQEPRGGQAPDSSLGA